MKSAAMLAFALIFPALAVAGDAVDQGLSASAIIEKNAAARGGLEAWRKIQTMTWTGRIDSANSPQPSLPFVLEMKRPNKTRFEIKVPGQESVRMFDGARGWKLRQAGQRKTEVQPYTPDELSFASDGQGMDGPLLDYQAKGIAITLDGTDEVEGRRAYRLNVKLPSGNSHHVWVDAQTFLEIKYDRAAHGKFGQGKLDQGKLDQGKLDQTGRVSVFYRNYKMVEGVLIPLLIETRAEGRGGTTDRMMIDRVLINPNLADREFAYSGAMSPGRAAAAGGQPQSSRMPPLRNPSRGISAQGSAGFPFPGVPGAGRERQ